MAKRAYSGLLVLASLVALVPLVVAPRAVWAQRGDSGSIVGYVFDQTGLPLATFPLTCPWTLKEVLDADFWPGAVQESPPAGTP